MKRSMSCFVFFLISSIFVSVYAVDKNQLTQHKLYLYEKPDLKSSIVEEVNSSQNLIPIYQKKDKSWIKVGNSVDGVVGWLNREAYQRLLDETDQSNATIETAYVSTFFEKGKKNKYQVEGYKNGKKLSQKEAEKLLTDIQDKQKDMQKQFQKIEKQMNEWFRKSMKIFQKQFNLDD